MMLGTLANVAAIIAGALVGFGLKQRIPERVSSIAMQGLALVTALIGITLMITTQHVLVVLVSMVTGGVVGELLRIEERLDRLGARVEGRFGKERGAFAKAFVTTTLLYCIGPLAIVGALQDGLRGDYSVLLTKSMMDGIASVAFASTLGIGVLFSALPLAAYQGGITIGASLLQPYLTSAMITEMTATGGLLILAIAMNLLRIAKIRVGNLLPAILVAAILSAVVL